MSTWYHSSSWYSLYGFGEFSIYIRRAPPLLFHGCNRLEDSFCSIFCVISSLFSLVICSRIIIEGFGMQRDIEEGAIAKQAMQVRYDVSISFLCKFLKLDRLILKLNILGF